MSVCVCQPGLEKEVARRIARNRKHIVGSLAGISAPAPFMVYPDLQEMLKAVGVSVAVGENGWVYLKSEPFLSLPDMPESIKEMVAEKVGTLIADTLTQQIGEGRWQFTYGSDNNEYIIFVSPIELKESQ